MELKKRVLIVDDEPAIGRVISIKLRLNGYECVTATSGIEAIELARDKQPDIILLDILMPGMSGFEVLDRIRSYSKVPVIVFTAKSDAAELAIKRGANEFIAKPFDPDRLVEKIKAVLNKEQ